ncbi:MAG TPA: NUDIX domain-containing protein [Polyangiales bacterium]|nr:NUDIX domain-containing protein [Polyangiales bacterium]
MTTRNMGNEAGKRRIRASAVCVYRTQLLCVSLRDPQSRVDRLFVPGGALEPGETAAAAAERETVEETGYQVQIAPDSELVARYDFVWNGVLFDVTTHFFRASLSAATVAAPRAGEPAYNEGVRWLALEHVDRELGFCAPILEAVRALL